jgi:hypothetical protein
MISAVICLGSQDLSSPLVFAEGLFIFYKLFSRERRILQKICSIKNVLNLKKSIL